MQVTQNGSANFGRRPFGRKRHPSDNRADRAIRRIRVFPVRQDDGFRRRVQLHHRGHLDISAGPGTSQTCKLIDNSNLTFQFYGSLRDYELH